MASQILLKKSTTASAVPTTSDVDVGEVAVNTEDKRLFTQDSGGSVVELGTTPSSLTTTGTVTFGSLSDGTITVTAFADEDNMASDSATLIPTQQSVKAYVDTEITNLIGGAPGALDTLNELAAALNDDANAYTTLNDAIALKAPLASPTLTGTPTAPTASASTNTTQVATTAFVQTELGDYAPLAGATFTGDVVLGANKATSTATPATDDTLTRKGYVDTQDALKLSLTGGTMSGAIDMGSSKITTTYTPTDNADLTTKTYVDGILGSATGAEAALADFDSVYQRSLATAPALDRNGDALTEGDLYFDTTDGVMYVYDGSSWGQVAPVATSFTVSQISDLTTTAAEINILDGVTATTTELNYLDITTLGTSEASKVVTADSNGVVTFDNGKIEEVTAITSSSNAATLNLRDGDNFTHTLSENVTYTFSNPAASGKASAFTLKVTQDSTARTITWPTSVDWAGGEAPTISDASGAVDYFVFITTDGGTNYYGFTAGQALATPA